MPITGSLVRERAVMTLVHRSYPVATSSPRRGRQVVVVGGNKRLPFAMTFSPSDFSYGVKLAYDDVVIVVRGTPPVAERSAWFRFNFVSHPFHCRRQSKNDSSVTVPGKESEAQVKPTLDQSAESNNLLCSFFTSKAVTVSLFVSTVDLPVLSTSIPVFAGKITQKRFKAKYERSAKRGRTEQLQTDR